MKLKALILDDEVENIEHLSYWLEKYCAPHIEVVAVSQTIEGALKEIIELQPDVLFLDVELANGITSFELLRQIPEWEGKVIFITAYKDYAIEAIKAKAFDYLLKPLSIKELVSTVGNVYESFEGLFKQTSGTNPASEFTTEFIAISHLSEIQLIRKSDIMYLTSSGNYTELFLENGNSTLSSKIIKVYESLLNERNFVRIHNSHIINLDYLVKIEKENGWICVMKNGTPIPVSRRKKDMLLALLNTI